MACPKDLYRTITASAFTPNNIVAGSLDQGVWYSDDAGVSWRQLGDADDAPYISGLVEAPGYVVVGTWGDGVRAFKTSNTK